MDRSAKLSVFRQVSDFQKVIRELGITLTFGADFVFFNEIPKLQPERHKIGSAFNPQYYPLGSQNALWMVGYNQAGEIVCTQAIKLLPVGDGNLADFLANNLHELRIEGFDYDEQKTTWELTPRAANISGRVAYHGELWLKGGPNGIRGGSTTALLARLMLLIAALKLEPDYFIGFQSPITSCRGLGAREGYMHLEQRSIVWHPKGQEQPIEDWLVWMSVDEAVHNLRIPPTSLCSLFEKTPTANTPKKLGEIA